MCIVKVSSVCCLCFREVFKLNYLSGTCRVLYLNSRVWYSCVWVFILACVFSFNLYVCQFCIGQHTRGNFCSATFQLCCATKVASCLELFHTQAFITPQVTKSSFVVLIYVWRKNSIWIRLLQQRIYISNNISSFVTDWKSTEANYW